MIVAGVDPGSRGSGLAVIDTRPNLASMSGAGIAPLLLASTTVRRPTTEPVTQPSPAYLARVVEQVRYYVDLHHPDLIAVEGITAPNAHVRVTNPEHILAAAMVYGAVLAHGWGVPLIVIKPGGHGSKPLGWYPDALVSDAERRPGSQWRLRNAGHGQLKDQRSAYDVAVAGHAARRLAPTTTYAY